jgi:hypothetical protein
MKAERFSFIIHQSAFILPKLGNEEQVYRTYRRMPAGQPQPKLSSYPPLGKPKLFYKTGK